MSKDLDGPETIQINFRVAESVRDKFLEIATKEGISTSEALRAFMRVSVRLDSVDLATIAMMKIVDQKD